MCGILVKLQVSRAVCMVFVCKQAGDFTIFNSNDSSKNKLMRYFVLCELPQIQIFAMAGDYVKNVHVICSSETSYCLLYL